MHSDAVGHEIPRRLWLPSILAVDHAAAPPVGLVEVITFPAESLVAQNGVATQETDQIKFPASIAARCHAVASPVGLVETRMLPQLSPIAHSEAVGHEVCVRL
jgi:hypothetical protein